MRKQMKRLSLAKETLMALQRVELSEVQGAESSPLLQYSICAECLWPSINFPCDTDYGYTDGLASCIPYC